MELNKEIKTLNHKKIIIFDLGGVILNFNHMKVCERLSRISSFSDKNIYNSIFSNGLEDDYNKGKLTSKIFYETIKHLLNINISFDDFYILWSDTFQENLEVSKLIKKLKLENYKLFLLSNTNEMHFNFVKNNFKIVNIFDDYILSFKVGYIKPNINIFRSALSKTNIDASNHIYIDDIEDYVNIAKALGMIGIFFETAKKLRLELVDFKINI